MGAYGAVKTLLESNKAINQLPTEFGQMLDARLMNGKAGSKLRQAVGLEDADGFMNYKNPGTLHRAKSMFYHQNGELAKGRIAGTAAGLAGTAIAGSYIFGGDD